MVPAFARHRICCAPHIAWKINYDYSSTYRCSSYSCTCILQVTVALAWVAGGEGASPTESAAVAHQTPLAVQQAYPRAV